MGVVVCPKGDTYATSYENHRGCENFEAQPLFVHFSQNVLLN